MRLLRRRRAKVSPDEAVPARLPQPSPSPSRPWADASWLAWQTLTYSGSAQLKTAGVTHHLAELREVAAAYGRLVMAELRIEESGQYAGAVRVHVGGVQLGSISHGLADDFRAVIQRLAAAGRPALCRALLDAEPGAHPDVWLCAKPEERAEDDPFLPPTLGERLALAPEVVARLDDVILGHRAKTKRVVRTAELLARGQRWAVVLDEHELGVLPGAHYRRVEEAQAAGFPLTCQVRILRQPDRPLRVEADFPTD